MLKLKSFSVLSAIFFACFLSSISAYAAACSSSHESSQAENPPSYLVTPNVWSLDLCRNGTLKLTHILKAQNGEASGFWVYMGKAGMPAPNIELVPSNNGVFVNGKPQKTTIHCNTSLQHHCYANGVYYCEFSVVSGGSSTENYFVDFINKSPGSIKVGDPIVAPNGSC